MNRLISFFKSERFWEIFRFGVAGGSGFVIDFAVLFILTEFAGFNYLVSSAISFILSVVVNYIMCVAWVFKDTRQMDAKAILLFAGSSVVGLGINQFLMWFFVEKIALYYMLAKIFATIIVMIWNYVMKRKAVVG